MKLGLNMIVKNEAHIILEGLECIWPLIDVYVIVDTGSTDHTKQIIKTFFDSKKIPGYIYDSEWKDFGTNRSEALQLCEGKMDYAIVFDADDLIYFPANAKEFLKHNLQNFNCALLRIVEGDGKIKHRRVQIMKMGDGWFYKDVLHEYPTNEKSDNKMALLPEEMYICSRRLGSRNQMKLKEKLMKDVQILLQGIEKEPTNDRYIFNLAAAYADAGMNEKAIEYFKKHVQTWEHKVSLKETNFICLLRISECYMKLDNIIEAEYWGNLAYQFRPTRSESLLSLAICFRVKQEYYKSFQYILKGKDIPYPKDDLSFVLQETYNGGFEKESCLVEYHIFPEQRKAITKRILKHYFFTDNFNFSCVRPIITKIESAITPVCIDVNYFGNNFRPSNLFVLDDGESAIVKYVDYEIKDNKYYLLSNVSNEAKLSSFSVSTKEALVNFKTLQISEIVCDEPAPFVNHKKPRGIEDIRLYKKDEQVYFTGNSYGEYLPQVCCSVVHGLYDMQKNVFTNVQGIKSPLQRQAEKNWLHIPKTDVFIYSWHPLRLCKIKDDRCIIFRELNTPKYFSLFSGSAPPVMINGRFLCLVHVKTEGQYFHNFIEFSYNGLFQILRVSRPFFFQNHGSIEYCLCIRFKEENESVDCYVTINDTDAAIYSILLKDIFEF